MTANLAEHSAPFDCSRAIDGVSSRDVSANFHVAPGIPVTADIKVGTQTILN
jgi:hypothetical protein